MQKKNLYVTLENGLRCVHGAKATVKLTDKRGRNENETENENGFSLRETVEHYNSLGWLGKENLPG
jgi:hypothetical protein